MTGDPDALAGARRAAELLLEHRMFRDTRDGRVIHPSWTKLHYPPYWHYDVMQGLWLLRALGVLGDHRAIDALDLLVGARRRNGRFSGPSWVSPKRPDAVDWGRGPLNEMLNWRAETLLCDAGRTGA